MKYGDRNDHAPLILLLEKDSFYSFHGAAGNADALAFVKEIAGLGRKAGFENGPDGVDFGVGDGGGFTAKTEYGDNAGSGEDGEALFHFESTKDVARKQGKVGLDDPIGPFSFGAIGWKEVFKAFVFQNRSRQFFLIGAGTDAVPGKLGCCGRGKWLTIEQNELSDWITFGSVALDKLPPFLSQSG